MTTREDLLQLEIGDIIRNEGSGNAYTVVMNTGRGGAITAVQAVDVCNPQEWTKIDKATGQPVAVLQDEVVLQSPYAGDPDYLELPKPPPSEPISSEDAMRWVDDARMARMSQDVAPPPDSSYALAVFYPNNIGVRALNELRDAAVLYVENVQGNIAQVTKDRAFSESRLTRGELELRIQAHLNRLTKPQ